MIKIITKIVVKGKTPSQISDWLVNLNEERYRQWHPAHRNFKRPPQLKKGSTIYFDEILEGFRIRGKWKIIDFKENEFSVLKAKTLYPIYLRASCEKIDNDTEITHELLVGFSFKGLEKVFDWFVRKFIFTKRKEEAIRRHAMEEFKNLETIL